MASALAALSNASATFTVAGAGVVTDASTGNVTPAAASITVALFLKADRVRGVSFPGVDIQEVVYDGYCLAALDSRIVPGVRGVLSFAGEAAVECEVMSVRLPYGKTGLLGGVLNDVLGERIELVARSQMG
jgi:hypothetical protein